MQEVGVISAFFRFIGRLGATAPVVILVAACTSAASQSDRGPLPRRQLVLVEFGASDTVAARLIKKIRAGGKVEMKDARTSRIRLADLGEGEPSDATERFRVEWPADFYVGLVAEYETGYSHPIRQGYDSGWITCNLKVALRDCKTGRLLTIFSVAGSEHWSEIETSPGATLSRHPSETPGPPISEATETATYEAVDEAVREISRLLSKKSSS